MCGIFGYNVCPDVASQIDAVDFTALGMKLNEPRGKEAAGWMAGWCGSQPLQAGEPVQDWDNYYGLAWYKDAGKPTTLPVLPKGHPLAIGGHTRAPSNSHGNEPSNNSNNHPVEYGKVLLTHNGNFRNHYNIKSMYQVSDAPKVDSAAMAVALHQEIEHPMKESDKLREFIEDDFSLFNGGYSMHAMWTNAPGFSLLVRGPEYPMALGFDTKRKMLIYSSLEKDVKALGESLGSIGSGLQYDKIGSGCAFMMFEGEVVEYFDFEPYYYTSNSTPTAKANRVSRMRVNVNESITIEDSKKHSWEFIGNTDAPTCLVEAETDYLDGAAVITFCDDYEWLPEIHDFFNPANSASYMDIRRAFSDAQYVYGWIKMTDNKTKNPTLYNDKSSRYFALFSNGLEIVVDAKGKIQDVYDHSQAEDSDYYPWISLEEAPPEIQKDEKDSDKKSDVFLTFAEWVVDNHVDYEGKVAPDDAYGVSNSNGQGGSDFTKAPAITANTGASSFISTVKKSASKPGTVSNLPGYSDYTSNVYNKSLIVKRQLICRTHSRDFSLHPLPLECNELLDHALCVLSNVRDLDDMDDLYDTGFRMFFPPGKSVEPRFHTWIGYDWEEKTDSLGFVRNILIRERCSVFHYNKPCEGVREPLELPNFMIGVSV